MIRRLPRRSILLDSARVFALVALLIGCDSQPPAPAGNSSESASSASSNPTPSDSTSSPTPATSNPSVPEPTAEWNVSEKSILPLEPVVYHSGREAQQRSILESLGGGVGVIDYDLDGSFDLWFPGGGKLENQVVSGRPNRLLKRQCDSSLIDVSLAAMISEATTYSHGAAITDYDLDGFPDVVVSGYQGLQLWHNQGDGSFRRIESQTSGLTDDSWSTSVAWGDFNGDSIPDLYVPHYVNWSFANHPDCGASHDANQREICSPRVFEAVRDRCYLGQSGGTFLDATEELHLPLDGKGLGAVIWDFDEDGAQDIYVANDTTPNFLLLNRGTAGFVEDGGLSGVAVDDRGIPNGSMGLALSDIDHDGKVDLFVANYQTESFALYRQLAPGAFVYSSPAYGLKLIEPTFVGFGSIAHDFDRDGDDDIIVSNGHVLDFPASSTRDQATVTLRNADRKLTRLRWPASHPFEQLRCGRGVALCDADGDGDADLAFTPSDAPAWELHNYETRGNTISVTPIGTISSRIPLGAQLSVRTNLAVRVQPLAGGGSYLSSHQPSFWVVIPEGERLEELIIRWPTGSEQSFLTQVDVEQIIVVETETEEPKIFKLPRS